MDKCECRFWVIDGESLYVRLQKLGEFVSKVNEVGRRETSLLIAWSFDLY